MDLALKNCGVVSSSSISSLIIINLHRAVWVSLLIIYSLSSFAEGTVPS